MPENTSRGARLRAWGLPVAAAVAGAGLGVGGMYVWGPAQTPELTDAAGAARGQQTVTVGLQTLEESVSATGTLAAVTTTSLAFDASGSVTAVYVEAGDTVAAGDVIATIDTLQLTASLRSAEAQLAQGEAQLANLEDADDGSDSSAAQIASAEAQVVVLQEAVAEAQADMDHASLVADIDGLVTAQPYAVGDVVAGGSTASSSAGAATGSTGATMGATTTASSTSTASGVTIVGQDQWTVSVSLDESEVAQIAEGDQVTFASDDVAESFYGVVASIANLPTTTSGTATYAVELQVTGAVDGLYDGTSVDASIVYLRQVDVLAVPTNAVTTTDGVSTVTVVDDAGATEEREVTLGDTIGSYTAVLDGLAEGEQLQVTVATGGTGSDATGTTDGFRGGMQLPEGMELPEGFQPPTGGQMPGGQG